MPAWSREPLVHFLFAGALLFALHSLLADPAADGETIVVDDTTVARLSGLWEQQWQRTPSTEEVAGLVRDHVRQEMLYREALALGLDEGDHLVRRRLVEKMEFLSEDLAPDEEPSDADLRTHLEGHPEAYERPRRVTFEHVFVSRDHAGDSETAARLLAELEAGAEPGTLGDRLTPESRVEGWTEERAARVFGDELAPRLFELDPGEWHGPLTSGRGLHLVRVEAVAPARAPDLDEVRDEVRRDLEAARRRQAAAAQFERLAARYEVDLQDVDPELETLVLSGEPPR